MAPAPPSSSIYALLGPLLLTPRRTWPRIAEAPIGSAALIVRLVLPLAMIGPAARLIGTTTFGWGGYGITQRPTLEAGFVTALVGYVLGVLGTLFLAFALAGTAPSFGGAKDSGQAIKVAAFSAVPLYLSGVFQLVPGFVFLGVLGGYCFYLLYLAAAPLLRVPPERARPFALAIVAAAIVIYVAVFGVTALVAGRFTPMMTLAR